MTAEEGAFRIHLPHHAPCAFLRDIMPLAVQVVMKWLPFYCELFCPIAIFQGRLRGAEVYGALAIQVGWVLAMWAAANLMWRRGLGHYQAVGG